MTEGGVGGMLNLCGDDDEYSEGDEILEDGCGWGNGDCEGGEIGGGSREVVIDCDEIKGDDSD